LVNGYENKARRKQTRESLLVLIGEIWMQPLLLVQTTLRPLLKVPLVKEVNNLVKHRKSPVNLWFDDGYEEDYTVVYPMLKPYNLSGTLSITTGNVGKYGFLTIGQIKTMIHDGWKIASHGVTHRNFLTLSLQECEEELVESFKWIRGNLHVNPLTFMPPYNQLTRKQRYLAKKVYGSVCMERYHFHSKNWRKNDSSLNPLVVANEHETLVKILEDIKRDSPFFKCELKDLKLPDSPRLPEGYLLVETKAKDIMFHYKSAWERFNEKPWNVPDDALVFFVEYRGTVVGTEFAVARDGIGTLHAAIVSPEHRKLGFYRLMSITGLNYLMGLGVETFELHTGVKRLWHFWDSLGFRRVATVSEHAQSGMVNRGASK
jgi:peptidoglycan/xylan/chitin deacetylase (PgdA/CDA1 family)